MILKKVLVLAVVAVLLPTAANAAVTYTPRQECRPFGWGAQYPGRKQCRTCYTVKDCTWSSYWNIYRCTFRAGYCTGWRNY